ncbi:MAG: AAA family ATPase [Oscillospiraceae bacterium]|nr:AAA family ATPase [Oscillospiraceae bacterium]
MIIRKMRASFGCLENAEMELHEGLNIVSAPNESGKSTWCAFIRAMLYGIDSAQREKGGVKPDKVKYAPWSGAPMAGEMDIEHEGKAITLRRGSKNAAAPMKDFSAVYSGTAQPVPGMKGTDAGAMLTGMPKAVFESSVFVRQAGLAVSNSTELEKRINAIISTGDTEAVSYSDADSSLRAWLRKRRHNRSGAIPALEAEIAEKRAAIDSAAVTAAERGSLEQRLAEAIEAEKAAAENSKRDSEARRSRLMEALERAREQAEAAEKQRAEAMEAAMRSETETEKGPFGGMSASEALFEAGKDADLLTELRSAVPGHAPEIILGILAALSLIAASVFDLPIFYGAAGVFFMVGLIYAALRNGKRKEAAAYAFSIVQRYNATDGEGIMAVAEEHAFACAAAEKANETLLSAEANCAAARAALSAAERQLFDHSENSADTGALARAQAETALIRRRIAIAEGRLEAMGDPMVAKTKLEALESRHAELTEQYDALSLAIETLREANDEMQQRFAPALGRRAAEIMSRLTGGKYTELSFSRELDAAAKRSGDTLAHEKAFLSEGTVDQIYLALRLAICDLALPEGCSCPLVLDDALVNFDDERMGNALEVLREIAEKRQVILFSCHDREARYMESR